MDELIENTENATNNEDRGDKNEEELLHTNEIEHIYITKSIGIYYLKTLQSRGCHI